MKQFLALLLFTMIFTALILNNCCGKPTGHPSRDIIEGRLIYGDM